MEQKSEAKIRVIKKLLTESVGDFEDYFNVHAHRKLLDDISHNSKVLDVGFGYGFISILLNTTHNCEVYGTDISIKPEVLKYGECLQGT